MGRAGGAEGGKKGKRGVPRGSFRPIWISALALRPSQGRAQPPPASAFSSPSPPTSPSSPHVCSGRFGPFGSFPGARFLPAPTCRCRCRRGAYGGRTCALSTAHTRPRRDRVVGCGPRICPSTLSKPCPSFSPSCKHTRELSSRCVRQSRTRRASPTRDVPHWPPCVPPHEHGPALFCTVAFPPLPLSSRFTIKSFIACRTQHPRIPSRRERRVRVDAPSPGRQDECPPPRWRKGR